MFKRIFKIIIIVGIIAVIFPETVNAQAKRSITALDTVAGFETVIEGSLFENSKPVSFFVYRPDGEKLQLDTSTGDEGTAEVLVPDTFTRIAGTYKVTDSADDKVYAEFQVFPGEMDSSVSNLFTDRSSIPANGTDNARINVRVTDEFGNPLESHEVRLSSSRPHDIILGKSVSTNSNGIASFLVASRETGYAIFTATDETSGIVLTQRIKVLFIAPTSVFKSVGGDPETVLLAQASQSATGFVIENMPATANVNETLSFQVKAVDSSGNVVSSYSGIVIFSSTDINAQLPNTYVFQQSDQGRHPFNLSLTLRTLGTQKVIVQQQGNPLIKGEKTIEIIDTSIQGSSQIRITKPATGTYSANVLEVAGEAAPNARVKIFDNGQQIAEVQANTSGRFSHQTSLLTDGQHAFHAESNGVQSMIVNVTIDSTAAQVEQVEITNDTLAPGETTQILIRSDPDLASVQATIGDFITDLEADPQNPGVYRGTLTAPADDGEYTVNVIITDKVGNLSPSYEVGKITVESTLRPATESSFSVPSRVQNLQATAGNARVTLTWSPANAEAGMAFYRIYYGNDSQKLNLIVNTKDANTQWYIPSLLNGTAYYFQVVGVDAAGNEGDNRSAMVSATPSADLPLEESISAGSDTSPVLCDPGPCPPDVSLPPTTSEDGPSLLFAVLTTIGFSSGLRFFKKRK